MSDIGITIENLTETEFKTKDNLIGYSTQWGIDSFSQYPEDKLKTGGNTSMVLSSGILAHLGKGGEHFYVCYKSSEGHTFGVKIKIPVQVLGMGDRPYYEIAKDVSDPDNIDWDKVVDDPSKHYSFELQDGISVDCNPTSGHTSLTVAVCIKAS